MPFARQRTCKHALLIEDGVLHGVRAEELSWEQSKLPGVELIELRHPKIYVRSLMSETNCHTHTEPKAIL
jgi:hypothetical protein